MFDQFDTRIRSKIHPFGPVRVRGDGFRVSTREGRPRDRLEWPAQPFFVRPRGTRACVCVTATLGVSREPGGGPLSNSPDPYRTLTRRAPPRPAEDSSSPFRNSARCAMCGYATD